jgi:hypothetical protein
MIQLDNILSRLVASSPNIVISSEYGENLDSSTDSILHFQHKIKCISCGLHFIVFSYSENWPKEGTTVQVNYPESPEAKVQAERGHAFCPECGRQSLQMVWKSAESTFVFDHVPGSTQGCSLVGAQEAHT